VYLSGWDDEFMYVHRFVSEVKGIELLTGSMCQMQNGVLSQVQTQAPNFLFFFKVYACDI